MREVLHIGPPLNPPMVNRISRFASDATPEEDIPLALPPDSLDPLARLNAELTTDLALNAVIA